MLQELLRRTQGRKEGEQEGMEKAREETLQRDESTVDENGGMQRKDESTKEKKKLGMKSMELSNGKGWKIYK